MKKPLLPRPSGLALCLAAMLTACGGGGDSPNTTPIAPPPPGAGSGGGSAGLALVTSVPTPTYAAGSEELAAFNKINAERSACGFGLLAQAPALDKSAKAHTEYMLVNGASTWSHYEDATRFPNGFTGVEPFDRAVLQGYPSASVVSEGFSSVLSKVDGGETSVRRLLSMPYHVRAMLDGWTEVGGSVRAAADLGIPLVTTVLGTYNYGYHNAKGKQQLPSGTLATYPCQGLVGSAPAIRGEEVPSPVRNRFLTSNPAGGAILMKVRDGEVLTVNSIQVFGPGNAPVALMPVMTAANDWNERLSPSEAFVLPDTPLAAHTSYRVVINGSIGTPSGTKPIVNHSFSFTTGEDIGF
jgi:uncharacterized protein YkwD